MVYRPQSQTVLALLLMSYETVVKLLNPMPQFSHL